MKRLASWLYYHGCPEWLTELVISVVPSLLVILALAFVIWVARARVGL